MIVSSSYHFLMDKKRDIRIDIKSYIVLKMLWLTNLIDNNSKLLLETQPKEVIVLGFAFLPAESQVIKLNLT